jgi:type IV pilus assembly protein PilQ
MRLLAIAIGAQALISHSIAATLDDVSYTTLPGNQQQIAFKLSESVAETSSFRIEQPARIAIDLMGTTSALSERVVAVGGGNVESVNIVEANDRTRVVLNLDQMSDYQTEMDGNILRVTIDGDDSDAQGDFELPEAGIADAEILPAAAGGEALIPASTEEFAGGMLDDEADDGGVVLELPASLPLDSNTDQAAAPSLPADAEVVMQESNPEASSPVNPSQIDVQTGAPIEELVEQTAPTKVEMAPMPQVDDVAYQTNTATNPPAPVATNFAPTPVTGGTRYSGEELSLNFQDIEVRSVLQLLADFTDLNIVVSDSVSGKVTLRLKDVPWDQALDIILRTKGLDKRASGNVIMVAPATEIEARETAEREAAKKAIELEPLRTEFVQVNYAKAIEVAAILKSETGGVLSERGNVTIDDRTNTILVNDTADVLGKVRALVTRLDVPVQQVLIESRIVIASDDFNREMGVRFGVSRDSSGVTGDVDEAVAISGNASGAQTLLTTGGFPAASDRFNVNLPVAAPTSSIGLALAKLPFGTLLELELSAMQAEGRGEVVSSPRVITANQHEAYIEQGVEIPYQEASSSGSTSTSFKKAVLSLRVKPQITPDERIIMDLTVNKDSQGQETNGIPAVNTREVSTQVLVANGETLVLGGIYEQTVIQQRNQVPFFGDLPLVGKLFQTNISEDDKSELLVFVTPKIIKDNEGFGN